MNKHQEPFTDEEYLYGHSEPHHHYQHSDDSSSVLFQSIQISIPVLPFIVILCLISIIVILRMIKFGQWTINWQIIAKSFRHQVVLLCLFVEIPLLLFYLFSLIKHGKKDRLLAVVLLLNGMFSGLMSFMQEKSLGFLVSLMGCFIASLVIDEAHVRTILLCLCFVLIVMKIRKIIFQNENMESEQWQDKRFRNVRFENDSLYPSRDSDDRNSLRNRFENYYRAGQSQVEDRLIANRFDTFVADEHTPTDDDLIHQEHAESRSKSANSDSSVMSFFRSFLPNRSSNLPKQQQPDILERKAVKLQRPVTAYERYLNSRNQPIRPVRESASPLDSSTNRSTFTHATTTSATTDSETALQNRPWSLRYSTTSSNVHPSVVQAQQPSSITLASSSRPESSSYPSNEAPIRQNVIRSSSPQAPSIHRVSFNHNPTSSPQNRFGDISSTEDEEFIPSTSTLYTTDDDDQ
ncbi:hypothetical protein C9374_010486 [Naegleria lovaniensis]|uniref:Uncharacterized protein n=1 Tax=Naegleria lovaniensis TaxID=51637 RepID=A0AA88GFP4_NAELO|nr:uncharacterized protein C9374_010486 [Naegleria lovaniensis]KAG2374742.1 hypothetical protein C9374_010486 [Naegleria lovaniensis]